MGRPSRTMKASFLPGWALRVNSRAAARTRPVGDNEARADKVRAEALLGRRVKEAQTLLGKMPERATLSAVKVRAASSQKARDGEARQQPVRAADKTAHLRSRYLIVNPAVARTVNSGWGPARARRANPQLRIHKPTRHPIPKNPFPRYPPTPKQDQEMVPIRFRQAGAAQQAQFRDWREMC